jgi:hypothetical protein
MCNPVWHEHNLHSHHGKRLAKDPGCFEDLLGITGRSMTVSEYQTRSHDAVEKAWAVYEGERRDTANRRYYDLAAFFVDADLVIAITDPFRRTFITCFHEHLPRDFVTRFHQHFPQGHQNLRAAGMELGDRQLLYRRHLQEKEECKMICKVKRLRGFIGC